MKPKQNIVNNKWANCDRRIKPQEKETINCRNCGEFFVCGFWAKDNTESNNEENKWPFCENFPRKSKYNAALSEQTKFPGEIRSRSKNNNDSSIRAKLRKYTNVRVLQK